jgi:AcrR family transcriptional regulator
MTSTVRARSRNLLRAELAEAASAYVAEHGYESTTADALARGIGISRATFFRYFDSKEDAVVSAGQARGGALVEHVDGAAAPEDGSAWTLLRQAASASVAHAERHPERERARMRMVGELPALTARLLLVRRQEQHALAEALERRLGDVRAADALAAAAISAIDLAWRDWARADDADFQRHLDVRFAAMASVGTHALRR